MTDSRRQRPLLVVIAAPSGAGKSTLCQRLRGDYADMVYSISCTTRAPRGGEKDGVDYCFLSEEEFESRVKSKEMLEHAVVHGFRYGTLRRTVEESMASGKDVLMDIDVQGARQIREMIAIAGDDDLLKRGFIDIFVTIPSLDALRARLEGRGEDSQEVIERRLGNAAGEIDCIGEFTHVVVNDDLEKAYGELKSLVERAKIGE